jgi:rhodanese-related sulfurtransferase
MPTRDVSPAEAHAALTGDPTAVYLDVRTEGEFEAGHPHGALNVPVTSFDPATHRPVQNPDFVTVVAAHVPRTATVLVGCQSGVRSLRACALLAAAGFTAVANVRAGFGGAHDQTGRIVEAGWADAGLPVEVGATPGACYADLLRPR